MNRRGFLLSLLAAPVAATRVFRPPVNISVPFDWTTRGLTQGDKIAFIQGLIDNAIASYDAQIEERLFLA